MLRDETGKKQKNKMGTKFDIKKTKQMLKDKIENKIQL